MLEPPELRADRPSEACGVFGVYGHTEASNIAYLGLHALQHRGQESAGIASLHRGQIHVHRQMGLVQEAFTSEGLGRLPGHAAIGHVRYSTAGGSEPRNSQPLWVDCAKGSLAVSHNGNLVNATALRSRLERTGSIFQSTADTEVLVHLMARAPRTDALGALVWSLGQLEGSYSLLVLTPAGLFVARDPRGIRPLCLGHLKDARVVASESNAFSLIGATFERDVQPGEVLVLEERGERSLFPFPKQEPALCIFEYIYFARPDSTIGGRSVYGSRKDLGRQLAREQPAQADVVIPVPDSGTPAAVGYAQQAGIPFEMGLIRSHYVGRTFIEPQDSIRHFGVRLKLAPVAEVLRGKRVVVVDDSVVRGTTSRKIANMVREAGAREVHLRISSPPTQWPCYYGIDTPRQSELVAAGHPIDEVARMLAVDSIGYLSIEGMHRAVGGTGYCDACFSGAYPVAVRPGLEVVRQGVIAL